MKKILIICLMTILPSLGYSAEPTCQTYNENNYCSYSGKVQRIYVNASNQILIYFDQPLSLEVASTFGYEITYGGAAIFPIDDKPEFAKMFYSTALTAQASGRNISIQMRSVLNGYMKFDRIWLAAP